MKHWKQVPVAYAVLFTDRIQALSLNVISSWAFQLVQSAADYVASTIIDWTSSDVMLWNHEDAKMIKGMQGQNPTFEEIPTAQRLYEITID